MLSPEEFFVGRAADAKGLAYVIPRSRYEHELLISDLGYEHLGVVLGERSRFQAIQLKDATNWNGLLVPNVRVEVDETTVVDADGSFLPAGTLVREGETLSVVATSDERFSARRHIRVPIAMCLSACTDGFKAAFVRWRIVVGQERNARVLREIDPAASAA